MSLRGLSDPLEMKQVYFLILADNHDGESVEQQGKCTQ